MKKFEKIYEANKELDDLFSEDFDFYDKDIFSKNALELLVEIGELANETRCFKYWSTKQPSSKEVILDEYADCMLMAFAFCNGLEVSLEEEFENTIPRKIHEQFLYLYKISSDLVNDYNKDIVKRILVNLVYLGSLLNFDDQDIIDGCLNKINRNKKRLQNKFAE
jgi:dimeric dUTPase (all-alpha-NTP-PPase superfamily)